MAIKDNYKKISKMNIGETVENRPVLILSMEEKPQANGNTYIQFIISDGYGKHDIKAFNTSISSLQNVARGDVADMTITVQDFKGSKSLKADNIKPTRTGATPADFLPMAPIDAAAVFDQITDFLKQVSDGDTGEFTSIADLACNLLLENREAFIHSSAAKSMHHDVIGGLVYHTVRMLNTASALCNVYKTLDKPLLLAAVAIHDLAKIREMDTSDDGDVTYTVEGHLMGHLYMGAEMVNDYANKNPGRYDPEKVMLLKHMILSHHLNPEWGAVKGPATAEAQMLHYVDQIDAKMYVYENRFDDLGEGEMTDKVPFGLENHVYKPKR